MRAHKIALATIIVVSAAGGLLCMATSGQTRAFRGPSLDQDLESQRAVLAQATVKSNVTEQDLNGTATEFENIAKFAIKQDGDRVENGLRAIVVAVDKLKGVVSGQTYRNLTDRLSDMREAQKNGDFEGVAFAAAEGYRATRLAQDPAALPAPIEVYMLDYTGLKAMATRPYWDARLATPIRRRRRDLSLLGGHFSQD